MRAKYTRTCVCSKRRNRRLKTTLLDVRGGLRNKQGVPNTIKTWFEDFSRGRINNKRWHCRAETMHIRQQIRAASDLQVNISKRQKSMQSQLVEMTFEAKFLSMFSLVVLKFAVHEFELQAETKKMK